MNNYWQTSANQHTTDIAFHSKTMFLN